jgi:primosomal protein N' (replication factor Y)
VAGRAGRSRLGGKVIIQTFAPEHYAVQAAAKHDYLSFYNTEISYRRQLGYPPFSRLASLTYSHTNEARCQQEAERMKQLLSDEITARGIGDLNIIGPAPAFIQRLRGHFRWQLVLRGANPSALLEKVAIPQGWLVDIDPVSLI